MGMGGFKPITGTIGRGLGEFTLPGSNAAFCQSILQKGITGEALRLESLSYVLPREGQGPELTPASQQPVVINLLMQLRAYCDESNTFLRQQHNLQLQLTRQLDQALSTAWGSVSSRAQQIRRAVEGEMLQAGQFQKALSELTQQLKKNGKSGEARLTRAALPGSSAPVHGKQAPSVGPASPIFSLKPETSAPSRTEAERKPQSLHTTPLTVVQKQEQGETVREQAPSPRGLRRREAGHGPHAQGEVHSPSKGKTGRIQKKRGESSAPTSHEEEIREPALSQAEETSRRSAAVTGKNSQEWSAQLPVQGTLESVSQDSASVVSKREHGSTARPVSAGSREIHGEETERPGGKSLPVLRTFPAISHAVSVFQPKILSAKVGMPGPVGNLPPLAPSGALGMPSFLSVFPSSYVSFPFGGIAKAGAISPGPLTLASKGAAWGRKEEQLSLFSGRAQGTPWIGFPLSAEGVFPGRKSQSPKAVPLRFREIGSNEEPASGYEARPLFPSIGPRTEWAETRAEAGKARTVLQTGENKRETAWERSGQEGVFGQKAAWPLGEKAKNASVSQSVSSKTPGLGSREAATFFPQGRAGLHSSLVHRAAAQAEQEAALSSVSSEAREPVYRTALPVGALSRSSALAGLQPVSGGAREPVYRTALPVGSLSRLGALTGPQPVSSEAREPVYCTALPVGSLSRLGALTGPQPVSGGAREPVYRTALPVGAMSRSGALAGPQPVNGEGHGPVYRTSLPVGALSRLGALTGPQPVSSGAHEPIYRTTLPVGAMSRLGALTGPQQVNGEAREPVYRTTLPIGALSRSGALVGPQQVNGEGRGPVYRTTLPVGAMSRSGALAGPQQVNGEGHGPVYRTALPAGVFRSNPVDQGHEASSFPPGREALPPSPIPEPSRKWEGLSPLPLPRPWVWDGEPVRRSGETVAIRSGTERGKSFFSYPFSLFFVSPAVPALESVAAIGRTLSLAPMRPKGTAAPARKRTLPFARPWRGGAWNGGKSFMPLTEGQSPLSHSSGVLPTAWEEEGPWDMVFRTSLDTQLEQGAEQERAEALSIGPMMGHLAFALEQGKTQESAPLQKEGAPAIRRGQGLSSLLSLENARPPARPDATSQAMVHTAFSPEFSEGTPVSQPDGPTAPSQDAPKGTGQSVVYRLPPRPQSAPQEKEESGEEVLRAQSVDAGYVSAMNAAYSYQAPESRPRPEAPGAISQETEERIIQQVLQDLNYNRMAAQVLDRVERRLRTERRKIGR